MMLFINAYKSWMPTIGKPRKHKMKMSTEGLLKKSPVPRCHSRAGGNPSARCADAAISSFGLCVSAWIPVFTGMTDRTGMTDCMWDDGSHGNDG